MRILLSALTLVAFCIAMAPLRAEDNADIEAVRQTTNKLIELLIQSGILSKEKAQALLDDAQRTARESQAAKKGKDPVVRVPYVPKVVREQIKEEIKQEVAATAREEKWGRPDAYPQWLERFRFYGDIRLRYQLNRYDANNATNFYLNAQETNVGRGAVFLNTTKNDDLWRYRFRLGLDAKLADWSMVGLRLATGSGSNPVSDNQTLGTTFNRSTFAVDRAFLKLDPVSWLSIQGGRIPNAFFSSNLVWDEDLNFEGAALSVTPKFAGNMQAFVTAGAFPLEKIDCTNATQTANCGKDKWLYGLQAGAAKTFGGGARLKAAVAYYDYKNIAGSLNDAVVNANDTTSIPKYLQKGNTLFNVVTQGAQPPLLGLAADYRLLNFTGQLDLANFAPYQVTLLGDYVKNLGYDRQKILARTAGQVNQEGRTKGYQVRLTAGHPKVDAKGNWQAFGAYKYLQRDAVFDGFTDSDFHLGGTDAKGWILGASYGIGERMFVRARWFSANEIDGPPLSIDVFQLDLSAEF
ncbi:MAG: putative porin [Burkholderiales bacterium]